MRVLVAEDEAGIRDLLVLGLEEQGYFVDAVDRGDDAIDMLKFYEYDIAVIDWRMPGAEGIEVVRWARKNGRPTAILMLTARDTSASFDMHSLTSLLPGDQVRVRRSPVAMRFLHPRGWTYFDPLRQKLHWMDWQMR